MRIFVGHILDERLIKKYNLPFAVDVFSRNLTSGGGFDKVYTMLATNVKGDIGDFDQTGYELIYSSWRKKPGIRSKLSFLLEQIQLFRKVGRKDSIWFSNLNPINFLTFILLKMLKPSVKCNVIIMDFTPCEEKWNRANFFLWLLNHADGTICLSHSDLFRVKNTACLPGVVPHNSANYPLVEGCKTEFLISGALHEHISMLRGLLIPAFAKLDDCTLHISGIASDEDEIKRLVEQYPNIIYHGKLTYEEYFSLLDRVPFVLSTRDSTYPEHQCNFPSKIIEGLLHNRIIVSTMHYPQLDGISYVEVPSSIDGFIKKLREVLKMDFVSSYANQGQLVKQRFNAKTWNEVMNKIEANE